MKLARDHQQKILDKSCSANVFDHLPINSISKKTRNVKKYVQKLTKLWVSKLHITSVYR